MGTKLIEVALPLDVINAASAREKSIRHGHPSTLHLWWARRPLAAARAVLFASLVDDPSSPDYRWPDGSTRARSEEEIVAERTRLHNLIEELVLWENSNNETVLGKARAEIMRATDGNPPPVLDPFAGGGSIPLEAQRLGLEAHASDLNPVAVLINKALIEIPPKFAGQPPVNLADRNKGMGAKWKGAAGLAADVRYYGQWMRYEAERRIGHLYPKVQLPPEQGGGEATVIAWLWARTVTCPNPACGAAIPLARSFQISKKANRETWTIPAVRQDKRGVDFSIGTRPTTEIAGTVDGKSARCCVCNEAAPLAYVRRQGQSKKLGQQLIAIVAEGARGRAYLPPTEVHIEAANVLCPGDVLETKLPNQALGFRVQAYGMTQHRDLFTPRQLTALTTFRDLIAEVMERVRLDALDAGLPDALLGIAEGGTGATAYAEAVVTYEGFALDRLAEGSSMVSRWQSTGDKVAGTFSRQAISMVWDFAEVNPFSKSTRNFRDGVEWISEVIKMLPAHPIGTASQADATVPLTGEAGRIFSTDPPYYDNIGYADLSDYFYVWLRHSVGEIYPDLFRTLLVPKKEELVATPYRFKGGKLEAEQFFEEGLRRTFGRLRPKQEESFPLTVYYAFKQAEDESSDNGVATASTGWETMLEGLIHSGFSITATWPMRTERGGRMRDLGANALASSIVLACRTRSDDAASTTRNEFLRRLRRELPRDLKTMQQSSIAPVDLAQAAIGPGMRIYSEYSGVLEPSGERLRIRTALQLINQVLDETLTEQDSEHDRETGWAVAWFEQFGMTEGKYDRAETLATARAVSVEGLRLAGIVTAGRGKVQLIPRGHLPDDWSPERDRRLTDWEIVQHLIRALETNGQPAAASLKRQLGSRAELAKELAYRLYTICERKGWAQEALSYNGLVVNWPDISKLASGQTDGTERQAGLV